MSEKITRLGYLGLAIEATSGSAESTPDIFIPFIKNSLMGHHEPLMDISARASRVKNNSSITGKKWGEGTVQMYLDSNNSGYLLKMALGSEARTQKSASPPVHDHLMYPTVSGNGVTSATLWDYKGVDVEQYAYASVDVCEVEINTDGIATISASMMSKFPSSVSAPALTTPSGTIFTWKDTTVQFGDTVQGAEGSSAIKLTNMRFTISNNIELNYRSGSEQPDTITTKSLEVSGSYSLFFENVTDRDRYYNLTKKSMVVTLTGAGLGTGGYTEKLTLVFKKIVLTSASIDTGLDDLFAIKCDFEAEMDQAQAGFVEATLRNGKASDYA